MWSPSFLTRVWAVAACVLWCCWGIRLDHDLCMVWGCRKAHVSGVQLRLTLMSVREQKG